jgi:hypothetical protein
MGSYQKEKKSHEDILRTQEEVPCHIPELTWLPRKDRWKFCLYLSCFNELQLMALRRQPLAIQSVLWGTFGDWGGVHMHEMGRKEVIKPIWCKFHFWKIRRREENGGNEKSIMKMFEISGISAEFFTLFFKFLAMIMYQLVI